MANFDHLTNLIQGKVIAIVERRPTEDQSDALQELIKFLQCQIVSITITRLKLSEEPSES